MQYRNIKSRNNKGGLEDMEYYNIGLAKKFVQVFLYHLMENPE